MLKPQPVSTNEKYHLPYSLYELRIYILPVSYYRTTSTLSIYSFILWEKIASVLPFSAIYNRFFISYFQLKSLFFQKVYYIYTHRPLRPIWIYTPYNLYLFSLTYQLTYLHSTNLTPSPESKI